LVPEELIVEVGAAIELGACVDVLEPASVSLEWSLFAPELSWAPLGEARPLSEGEGAVELSAAAPEAAEDSEILIRARLVDAMGRERVAHLATRVVVVPCSLAGGCGDEPGDEGDAAPDDEAGCGCRLGAGTPGPPVRGLFLGLIALGLRRRAQPLRITPRRNM
jgi:MYXO-CTERM domain-containing protein